MNEEKFKWYHWIQVAIVVAIGYGLIAQAVNNNTIYKMDELCQVMTDYTSDNINGNYWMDFNDECKRQVDYLN